MIKTEEKPLSPESSLCCCCTQMSMIYLLLTFLLKESMEESWRQRASHFLSWMGYISKP
jgi:hypothetical protein